MDHHFPCDEMTKMKKTIKNNDLSTKPLTFYPNSFVPPNLAQMENFKDVAEHKGTSQRKSTQVTPFSFQWTLGDKRD